MLSYMARYHIEFGIFGVILLVNLTTSNILNYDEIQRMFRNEVDRQATALHDFESVHFMVICLEFKS